jgi:hypothetical protein
MKSGICAETDKNLPNGLPMAIDSCELKANHRQRLAFSRQPPATNHQPSTTGKNLSDHPIILPFRVMTIHLKESYTEYIFLDFERHTCLRFRMYKSP